MQPILNLVKVHTVHSKWAVQVQLLLLHESLQFARQLCAQKLNPLQIGAHIVEVAKTLILYSDATLFPFYSLGRKVKAKLYQIDCCHCSGSYYIVLLLLCNYMLSIGTRDCHFWAHQNLYFIKQTLFFVYRQNPIGKYIPKACIVTLF